MRSCLSHRVNERCVIIRGAAFCLLIKRRAKMGPSWIALLLLCGWSCTLRHKVSLEASTTSSTHRSVAFTLLLVSLIIQIAESVQILSMSFFPGHHSIIRPHDDPWTASPHDRKRSVSQIPVPTAALFVPAQHGGRASHTQQQLRPLPGEDPYRRKKSSQSQHPLL